MLKSVSNKVPRKFFECHIKNLDMFSFLNPTLEFRQAELDIKIGGSRVDMYEKVG